MDRWSLFDLSLVCSRPSRILASYLSPRCGSPVVNNLLLLVCGSEYWTTTSTQWYENADLIAVPMVSVLLLEVFLDTRLVTFLLELWLHGDMNSWLLGRSSSYISQTRKLILSAVCSLWAIAMAVLIPDAPYATRFLTRREAVVCMSRKRDDYHTVEKRQLKMDQAWEAVKDLKTYL